MKEVNYFYLGFFSLLLLLSTIMICGMKHEDKKENYCIEKVQAVPIQFSKTTGIIPSPEKPFRRYLRNGN